MTSVALGGAGIGAGLSNVVPTPLDGQAGLAAVLAEALPTIVPAVGDLLLTALGSDLVGVELVVSFRNR